MGDVPEGYKETKIGVIPEDWEVKKLKDISDCKDNKRKPLNNSERSGIKGEIPYYGANGVVDYISEYIFNEPLILMAEDGGNFEEFNNKPIAYKISGKSWVNNHAHIITNKIGTDFDFLYYSLVHKDVRKYINGSTRSKLTKSDMLEIEMNIPPLKEQQKIAEILSTWDTQIENLENLISKKIETKKGLMQNLLTGEVRFPGFEDEWKDVKLGDILNEFSEKTHENNQHMILSVTKTGIIPQSEQFNKQVASSDNAGYKILRYGNLVFSSMNLWMGSLDILRTYEIGIVSPAYKTFKINYSLVDIDFIQDFLKSKHMIWIYNINSEQGASIVRRNLDLDGLLSTKIMLPELREQQKIGKMLSTQDKEIDLLKQKLELVKTQKKGLMQNLLTGKIRVKTS